MAQKLSQHLFTDKQVIISPTRHFLPAIQLCLINLFKILDQRSDVYLVIIDNNSSEHIKSYLRSLDHPQAIKIFLPDNIGKARATNQFISEHFDPQALPSTIWSIDPDIIVDLNSFNYLTDAIINMPDDIKVLSPRYKKNGFNAEMNLYFPARNILGKNGKKYNISFPFLCCVAGGALTMTGKTMRDLFDFRFFPTDQYQLYGNDDTAIFHYLRKKHLKSGYLNGTEVTHLRSADRISNELQQYIDNPA